MLKDLTKFCAAGSIITLIILGTFVESCKKSSPAKQSAAKTEPNSEIAKSEPNKADANGVKMMLLDFKLPHSVYVGTKIDVKVPDLDRSTDLRGDFYVPEGTSNVALGKPAVCNQEPIIGDVEMITDGDKEAADGSFVEFGPWLTYITLDLKDLYNIYAIVVWHYHQQQHAYFDVIVQVSNDPNFINGVKTLFNNDRDNSAGLGVGSDLNYMDTYEGKLIDAKGIKARYVRLYSNGNSINELNHYIEVEVYGKPAE